MIKLIKRYWIWYISLYKKNHSHTKLTKINIKYHLFTRKSKCGESEHSQSLGWVASFSLFSAIGTHHVGMANSCLLLPFREEGKWRAYPVSECCYCDESILCMFIRLSVYVAVSLFMFYFVRWCLIWTCLFVLFFIYILLN